MTQLSIHRSFRIAFIGFGMICVFYGITELLRWVRYKRTQSVISVEYVAYKDRGEIKYDTNRIRMRGTNPVLTVGFLRSSGSLGGVAEPERFLPGNAKPGDHVTVLCREEGGSFADAAVIYSFKLVWRKPVSAVLVGAFFICLGLWFRSRHGYVFRTAAASVV